MEREKYESELLQAKINLNAKYRVNIQERLSLNQLMVSLQGNRDMLSELGLDKEYVRIKYTLQAYLHGLNYEGQCLQDMEDLFKEE